MSGWSSRVKVEVARWAYGERRWLPRATNNPMLLVPASGRQPVNGRCLLLSRTVFATLLTAEHQLPAVALSPETSPELLCRSGLPMRMSTRTTLNIRGEAHSPNDDGSLGPSDGSVNTGASTPLDQESGPAGHRLSNRTAVSPSRYTHSPIYRFGPPGQPNGLHLIVLSRPAHRQAVEFHAVCPTWALDQTGRGRWTLGHEPRRDMMRACERTQSLVNSLLRSLWLG